MDLYGIPIILQKFIIDQKTTCTLHSSNSYSSTAAAAITINIDSYSDCVYITVQSVHIYFLFSIRLYVVFVFFFFFLGCSLVAACGCHDRRPPNNVRQSVPRWVVSDVGVWRLMLLCALTALHLFSYIPIFLLSSTLRFHSFLFRRFDQQNKKMNVKYHQ